MIFGIGAAMGWSASEVKSASLWELFSAWQGYVAANTPKQGNKLTESERAELAADVLSRTQTIGGTLSTQTYLLDGDRLVPAGVVTFEL